MGMLLSHLSKLLSQLHSSFSRLSSRSINILLVFLFATPALFAFLTLFFESATYASPPESSSLTLKESWQVLSPRIAVRELVINPEALFPSRILFARLTDASSAAAHPSPASQPPRPRLRVLTAAEFGYPLLTAREIAGHSGASLAINANFFDENGAPLGVIVSGGKLQHQAHRAGRTLSGIFQMTPKGPQIVHRDAFSPSGILEAIQAGPRLIDKSAPIPGVRDTFTTRRAGICITSSGDIIVYCVSSALVTLTVPALQELLASSQIGCTEALNLDGGGSAQLYARGAQTPGVSEADATRPPREVSVDGIDRVPVFLGFFEDDDTGAEEKANSPLVPKRSSGPDHRRSKAPKKGRI